MHEVSVLYSGGKGPKEGGFFKITEGTFEGQILMRTRLGLSSISRPSLCWGNSQVEGGHIPSIEEIPAGSEITIEVAE